MNFYIADCHLGHSSALHFDHRPFDNLHQMEEVMVMRWNTAVRKRDTVYILGDFCLNTADEWLRIVRKLNGIKILITGNHDLTNFPTELKNQFADITPFKEIMDNGMDNSGRKALLSHYPMPFYKRANNEKYFMLCGHVHAMAENDYLEKLIRKLRDGYLSTTDTHSANRGQIYNVGAMLPWMEYTPRTLNEIINRWEECHAGYDDIGNSKQTATIPPEYLQICEGASRKISAICNSLIKKHISALNELARKD